MLREAWVFVLLWIGAVLRKDVALGLIVLWKGILSLFCENPALIGRSIFLKTVMFLRILSPNRSIVALVALIRVVASFGSKNSRLVI